MNGYARQNPAYRPAPILSEPTLGPESAVFGEAVLRPISRLRPSGLPPHQPFSATRSSAPTDVILPLTARNASWTRVRPRLAAS